MSKTYKYSVWHFVTAGFWLHLYRFRHIMICNDSGNQIFTMLLVLSVYQNLEYTVFCRCLYNVSKILWKSSSECPTSGNVCGFTNKEAELTFCTLVASPDLCNLKAQSCCSKSLPPKEILDISHLWTFGLFQCFVLFFQLLSCFYLITETSSLPFVFCLFRTSVHQLLAAVCCAATNWTGMRSKICSCAFCISSKACQRVGSLSLPLHLVLKQASMTNC